MRDVPNERIGASTGDGRAGSRGALFAVQSGRISIND
jgi:hypothetical protein